MFTKGERNFFQIPEPYRDMGNEKGKESKDVWTDNDRLREMEKSDRLIENQSSQENGKGWGEGIKRVLGVVEK